MTLITPDHASWYADDDPNTVDLVPVLRDPVDPPANPPSIHELDRAADVILHHLAEGYEREEDTRVTHAHVVTDLNRWINPNGFRVIASDYESLPMDGHRCPISDARAFIDSLYLYLQGQGYDNRRQAAA